MINATLPAMFATLPQPLPSAPSEVPFDLLLNRSPQLLPAASGDDMPNTDSSAIGPESVPPVNVDETWLAFLGLNPAKPIANPASLQAPPPNANINEDGIGRDPTEPTETALVRVAQPLPAADIVPLQAPVGERPAIAGNVEKPTDLESSNEDLLAVPPADVPTVADGQMIAIAAGLGNAIAGVSRPVPPAVAKSAEIIANVADERSLDLTRAKAASVALPTVTTSRTETSARPPAEFDVTFRPDAEFSLVGTEPEPATNAVIGGSSLTPSPQSNATGPGVAGINGVSASPAQPVAPNADAIAALAERQLDLARDTRWIDELARDIVASSGRSDRLSFTLMPPQLGQLNVDLSQSDLGLSVRLNSESEATTQIVSAAQPRLVEELKSQGIRVANTEVSTGSGQQHGSGQHQNQQPRDDGRLFEFAWPHFEASENDDANRPGGRFA